MQKTQLRLLLNNLHILSSTILGLREIKTTTGGIQRFIPRREMKSSGLRIVGLTCGYYYPYQSSLNLPDKHEELL
ncbi:MAG: hypothetical protein WAL42_02595, partial [Nitrososphaeraceae archaeon]